jgi:two-component sensor histidine kinase
VRRVNPMFIPTFGFDPVGLNVGEVMERTHCCWLDGRPCKLEDQPTPRALEGETVYNQRFVITRPDGVEMALETAATPLRVGDRIVGTVTVWHDITERENAADRLKLSLREKEVLLKEIHHRVKNNLQVIASLVDIQTNTLDNPALRGVFRDVRDRVRSMALVHEKLYQSESLARVEFADYTRSLLEYLARAHGNTETSVGLKLDLRPVSLSVEAAVPCGLILNELVTNAFKHAFHGRSKGKVTTALRTSEAGQVCLRVSDNGVGLPAGMDWRQSRSLGLRLIHLLAGQLNATVEVRTGAGTEFLISFQQSQPEQSGERTNA